MIRKKLVLALAVSATMLNAADFSLGSIETGVSEIDSALGTVNNAIDQISGFDLDSILQDTGMDSELLGCLTQEVDLSQILGQIPSSDGVCGLVNSGFSLSSILSNPIAKCAGANIEMPADIQSMQDKFGSFCTGSTTTNTTDTGGWDSTTGNSGGYTANRTYSSVGIVSTNIESGSVSGGVKTSASAKPLEDKTYPSGLKVSDLYSGDGGGKLPNTLFTKPDSADAEAIKSNDKHTLILKDMALKLNGDTNENNIHLPNDQLNVIKDENDAANFISLGKIDYFELENTLIVKAREKFAQLDANSLSEYYIKEKQAYQDMVANDAEIKEMIANIKENAMASIGNYYNMKLMQLKKRDDYLINTSYTMERLTKPEVKDEFKAKALLQQNDETLIKSDMAIAKREANMKMDKTIQQAYYKASIFRADIAKKEIDTILKAVDTAIH